MTTTTYELHDHLSNRLDTNTSGVARRTLGTLPFGDVWYETGTADKWKFTSYERDTESNLDYATFRFSSSRLGRFMSADLLAGSTGDPPSLNRYAYVTNNPTNSVDPLGLLTATEEPINPPRPIILLSGFSVCNGSVRIDGFMPLMTVLGCGGPAGTNDGPEEPPPADFCISPSLLNTQAYLAYQASRAGAWLTGGTVGVGVGGGAGFGLGPKGLAAIGLSISGSGVFKTDGVGNSALVFSFAPPQGTLMSTNPNLHDAGAAANVGVQLTADRNSVPTELSWSASLPDVNGSFGPVGFDWTADSVSLQVGAGVGARVGVAIGGSISLSIPMCKR